MKIRFSKKWYNPLYFHLNHYIKDPSIRRIMVYGGKSSAKTLTIAQLLSKETYLYSNSNISYRKESTTIKTTLKEAFEKAIKTIRCSSVFVKMDYSFRALNGHKIIFKGLDTEGKVKGIEGYKYLNFDELDHFLESEWTQANLSLRGMPDQKLFATWNPIDENIWIKKYLDSFKWNDLPLILDDDPYTQLDSNSFVKLSEDGKTLLIKTTYHDNKWMVGGDGFGYRDQNLIDDYEELKNRDENSYNVNVLGDWGVLDKSGKFCYAYDKEKLSVKTVWDNTQMTWLSFDFNRDPITCGVIQDYDNKDRVIEAIKLHDSNIYALCDYIRAAYPNAFFMVTGDATGQNKSALVKDNINYYTVIQDELSLNDGQLMVPTINPKIVENKVLVNALLQNYPIEIDPDKASSLHYDMAYVEVTEENKIKKDDRKDEKQQADSLDWWRYYCNVKHKEFLRIPNR